MSKLKADEDSYKKLAASVDKSKAGKSVSGKAETRTGTGIKTEKAEEIELVFDGCVFSNDSVKILCDQINKYHHIKMLFFKNCTFYPKGDKEQSRTSMIPIMQLLGKAICGSSVEHIYFDDRVHLVGGVASAAFAKELMSYAKLKTLVCSTGPEADITLCDVFEKGQSCITLFELRATVEDPKQRSAFDVALNERLQKMSALLEKRKLERSLTDDVKADNDLFQRIVDLSLPKELRFTAKTDILRIVPEGNETIEEAEAGVAGKPEVSDGKDGQNKASGQSTGKTPAKDVEKAAAKVADKAQVPAKKS